LPNNNNNANSSVYGAVIMTKVIVSVHLVHLMNADRVPGGCQPSDQANLLESASNGCYHPHPPSSLLLFLSMSASVSFTGL